MPGSARIAKIDNYTKSNFVGFMITCFSAITMAVFIAVSQTYFITDALGIGKNVGNYIGTLGFCDELLSLVTVPFVGVLSDRIGTRPIVCFGFVTMGFSLFGFAYFVKSTVYPWMLFWRLLFALGLTSSVGVLTVMLLELNNSNFVISDFFSFKSIKLNSSNTSTSLSDTLAQASESLTLQTDLEASNNGESELENEDESDGEIATTLDGVSQLNKRRNDGKRVSIVGILSGIGAIFAVFALLRLPVWFGQSNPAGVALRKTYYTVGTISFLIAIVLFFTLYKDENKKIFRDDIDDLFDELDIRDADGDLDLDDGSIMDEDLVYGNAGIFKSRKSYFESLKHGVQLSIQNPMILVAYFGNFVARCATITTTIFVPFFVNSYFYSSGKCSSEVMDVAQCPESYILASILTGLANVMVLFFAPIVGIFIDRMNNHAHGLLIANVISFIGFFGMAIVKTPDSSILAVVAACLMGVAQISFILISMTMLSNITSQEPYFQYKGSITGVSQFIGGTGILLISLFGGLLADIFAGAPFVMVALINGAFIFLIFRLRRVKENNNRDFNTVVNKFKGTRLGGLIFRNSSVNTDEF